MTITAAPGDRPKRHDNSLHSALRERIIEHCFVGDLLRLLWRKRVFDVEVLRSEFDAHGYDLVLGRRGCIRHIQVKTGSGRPSGVSASVALGLKPSGCVLWINVDQELTIQDFYFFGGAPGEGMPSIEGFKAQHSNKRDANGARRPRPQHRMIPPKLFVRVTSLESLATMLFGNLDS